MSTETLARQHRRFLADAPTRRNGKGSSPLTLPTPLFHQLEPWEMRSFILWSHESNVCVALGFGAKSRAFVLPVSRSLAGLAHTLLRSATDADQRTPAAKRARARLPIEVLQRALLRAFWLVLGEHRLTRR